MKVYLIRHAESVGNIRGSLTSTTDFALTEKGRLQAKRLGESLQKELMGKRIAAYCSPLLRAKQTLGEILSCVEAVPLHITETPDLKEMDLGKLEGIPFDEQLIRYPHIDLGAGLSVLSAPDGECYADVKGRVRQFCDIHIAKNNADCILVASHGITLRVLTNVLLQRPDKDVDRLNWFENTAVTVLDLDRKEQAFTVEKLMDHSHLRELSTPNFKSWGIFADPGAYLSING